MHELLEWIEHHLGLAAWFQAIGAIVAVGVAIWVPAYQHKVARDDAEKDRRLKARSLALRMLPALLDFDSHVKQAIQKTQTISLAKPGPIIIQLVSDATVGIPQELVDDADQLYLLGEKAGFPTQQLLAFLGQHTRVLERAQLAAVTTVDQSVIPEVHRTIAESLAQIGNLLDVSIERVRAIHNGEW